MNEGFTFFSFSLLCGIAVIIFILAYIAAELRARLGTINRKLHRIESTMRRLAKAFGGAEEPDCQECLEPTSGSKPGNGASSARAKQRQLLKDPARAPEYDQ